MVAVGNYAAQVSQRRIVMTIDSIIILSGITFAFALFAATLLWGDYYTNHAKR
jgi:hypothetical protein